jgi:hypothetical protein
MMPTMMLLSIGMTSTKSDYLQNRVLYKSLKKIQEAKSQALVDLIAYTDDQVRYKRRLRFIKELIIYEKNLIENFENFNSDNPIQDFDDQTIQKIRESIDLLTLVNS